MFPTLEFLLEELKALCEHSARRIVSVANVAKMLLAAERYQADTLKTACLSFVQKNMPEVIVSIPGQKSIALCIHLFPLVSAYVLNLSSIFRLLTTLIYFPVSCAGMPIPSVRGGSISQSKAVYAYPTRIGENKRLF